MRRFHKFPLLGVVLFLGLTGSLTAANEYACSSTDIHFTRANFPKGFIFGTATAAFQVSYMHYMYKIEQKINRP